jgi:dCTP deaminase
MVLSNTEILKGIEDGLFSISPLHERIAGKPPFNSTSVDLRLSNEVFVPEKQSAPVQLDLSKPGIAGFLLKHSKKYKLTEEQPFTLKPNQLVITNTLEKVSFVSKNPKVYYSARVEGKSSLARCGILIHFTAPTIHTFFEGPITLEVINLGSHDFLLKPGMFICQLVIEEVKGIPAEAPNQFSGQKDAVGTVKKGKRKK